MYVAIYTRKGTLGKRFLSVLKLLIIGRKAQLKGRRKIGSWKVQRQQKPVILMHTNQGRYPGVRVTLARAGTPDFRRDLDAGGLSALGDLPEPELLATISNDDEEDPLLEKFVGMLARHAKDLGVASVNICLDDS